jgi:hypothetical protein
MSLKGSPRYLALSFPLVPRASKGIDVPVLKVGIVGCRGIFDTVHLHKLSVGSFYHRQRSRMGELMDRLS